MAIETPPLRTGPGDLPPDRAPRRWPWFVALALLGLVAGAVTFVATESSEDKVVDSTTATTTPTVSDPVLIKAYLDAWAAWDRLTTDLKVPLDDPVLERTMTEPLLGFVRHQLTDLRSQKIYYEPGGLTHLNTHLVERSAERAVLRSCMVDKSYGYNAAGARLAAPGVPGTRTSMEAIVVRTDEGDVWKVSSRYPQTGGQACDGV